MNNEKYIELAEEYTRRELNSLYREIPLKDTTSKLLRKYFNAMALLYGIIPLHKAKKIIFSLSPKLVTEDEFLAFAEIARHECEEYKILGEDELFYDGKCTAPLEREIIALNLLDESLDSFFEMENLHRGKPYYVPDKKHLLEYTDPFYCEDTPEKIALLRFMSERLNLTDYEQEAAFEYILCCVRYSVGDISSVLDYFKLIMEAPFKSEQDLSRFLELYGNFHNTTRMPCNRGYTPKELRRMAPAEEQVQSITLGPNIRKFLENGEMSIDDSRKQVLSMDMPNEAIRQDLLDQLAGIVPSTPESKKKQKVGRNDPCPCGSGKKYKKCCGK